VVSKSGICDATTKAISGCDGLLEIVDIAVALFITVNVTVIIV